MPPASDFAPLRIAGSPVRACWIKAPRRVLQLRVLHCDLHPPAVAGRMALIKRAKDADRQQHAGAGVAQSRPRLARPPIALAGDRHRAAAGLGDHVEGEVVLVGAAAAEPFDLAHRSRRGLQRVHDLPAEPQPLDRARREILDEDVGAPRHLLDQRKAALGFESIVTDFLLAL